MRIVFSFWICFATIGFCTVGCSDSDNSLATDSGEMTVEQYEAMRAEEAGAVNEAQSQKK